jgi:hypothetical protein
MVAGVQFIDVWIPAYAGMTSRYNDSELNNILKDISRKLYKSGFKASDQAQGPRLAAGLRL